MAQTGAVQTPMLHAMHATIIFAREQQNTSAMQAGVQPYSGPKLRKVHGQTGYCMPVGQEGACKLLLACRRLNRLAQGFVVLQDGKWWPLFLQACSSCLYA